MTKQLTLHSMVTEIKGRRGEPLTALESALQKKVELEKEILALEKQIFNLETSYLENTAQIGDLVRGWGDVNIALAAMQSAAATASTAHSHDGHARGASIPASGVAVASALASQQMKKRKINENDRLFSSSSVSATRNPDFFSQGNKHKDRGESAGRDTEDLSEDLQFTLRPSKQQKIAKKKGAPKKKVQPVAPSSNSADDMDFSTNDDSQGLEDSWA